MKTKLIRIVRCLTLIAAMIGIVINVVICCLAVVFCMQPDSGNPAFGWIGLAGLVSMGGFYWSWVYHDKKHEIQRRFL